jgi:hypothetical protein
MKKWNVSTLLKKFGLAGFLFFLLKGLAWLALGYFGASALFK